MLRDGRWQLIPGRTACSRGCDSPALGRSVPADLRLFDGVVESDESDLTGESQAVEKSAGATVYAGSRLKRGEASGEVTATGQHTYFGKTAELVKTAKTASHLQEIIFAIVKSISSFLMLSSLEPCSFTPPLHTCIGRKSCHSLHPFGGLGACRFARNVHDSDGARRARYVPSRGARDAPFRHRGSGGDGCVVYSDKTGTITQNRLVVGQIFPIGDRSSEEVLRIAALASDAATQDPIDLAVFAAAQDKNVLDAVPHRIQFIPFDPATKRSEAIYEQPAGKLRVIKGAPDAVISLVRDGASVADEVERLAGRGARVLAVAAGTEPSLELVGLLGLEDPIREDSKALVQNLKSMGVRVIIVTGDGAATARAVSLPVGIGERVGSAESLRNGAGAAAEHYDVFAGVFPEDKFRLVEALQRQGHVVGMTGDGVNDAPALKQAEAGIAVSTSD